ncbi:MAG TPA: transglutaminase domain-containing protein [Candidatus Kryptonia bacterium]|nr:transglutaminase domain-containing protein [Candidatus Kryptonia bacterium]
MQPPIEYYTAFGPMTALGAHAGEFRALPKDLASLCEVAQGVLIHRDIAPWLYGIKLTEAQREDGHLRPIAQMLTRIHELDSRPLTAARDVGHRLPSVCRHFSLMLCSMLRYQGIPSRPRCGFGAYFTPGKFEDHWVCEYWNAEEKRWILVNAQLDSIQRNALSITFNPLDVPRDRFIIAGDAWQMCRTRSADPAAFGLTHAQLKGMWFIAGNVVRDLASLNRMEMLPWDVWGLMGMDDASITNETKSLLDKVATLTLAPDNENAFSEACAIYESDDRLRVPLVVFNALHNTPEKIAA